MIEGLPINGLDLAVCAVLLISALLAFIRGFVHEVLSVAAWAGALAAATYGLPYARPFAHKIIPFGWAADAAAATVIFLVVLVVLGMMSHAVAMRIQKSALNNLDRTLGFVFGLARAVLILGVGLIVVDWLTDRDRPTWVRTAKTLPIIESAAGGIKTLVPASFMAPSELAREAAKKASAATDAKKAFERLATPAAAAEKDDKAGSPKETTYQNNVRQDMERLLRSTGEAETPKASESPPHE
ncbi:MAG: CvpA family protein [Rhodospirillaceae bacterium]|nr:CvpA family protein [Rhodospirillaceae bacterium]